MNNDIISRSALLEQVRHSKEDNPINQSDDVSRALRTLRGGLYDTFIDIIQTAPAADAEPVRYGNWQGTDKIEEWYAGIYKCSLCGIETMLCVCDKYCPGCGAKMDVKMRNAKNEEN